MQTNNERMTSSIPTQLKRAQLLDSTPENPALAHPAAQPLVNALKHLAFQKNPTASAAAIEKQVSDYLSGFASALNAESPEVKARNQQAASKETDWSTFL
jgi:hypothetical protein